MRFKDPDKIHTAIEQMRLANYPVARNRAKVNDLFNGNPAWSEDERVKNKIFTNINPLDGTRIAFSSRQALDNAVLKPGNFFGVKAVRGPLHKRAAWGNVVTTQANKLLRRSRPYKESWKASNCQVVLHGVGPTWWSGRDNPVPLEVGIEDVLVPAQTLLNFSNLEFFAVYRQWTYSELFEKTHGKSVDPGWNMKLVNQLLDSLSKQELQSTVMGTRWLMPEKLSEDLKENAGLFMTSAAPTLFIWDFYFRRHEDSQDDESCPWDRRIVLDYMQMQPEAMKTAMSDSAKTAFLYEKDEYSTNLKEMIHFQIGNCSNVAPFRYYSIRSLGFLTFGALQLQMRLFCRFMDSTFANLLELFRNVGEDDRERLEKVDLWHMGIVPDGLSFVTAAERHEINQPQVEMALAMLRQKCQESSASWLPQVDTGTSKEQTLGEVKIALATSASISNAMLTQHYDRAIDSYEETFYRLRRKGNPHWMAKKFRQDCLEQGVPEEVLNDRENWELDTTSILGGGNQALEMIQAEKLMAARGAYDAPAQRKILWQFTLANTNSADQANDLVPLGEQEISEATHLATMAFGTLMEGLPVVQKRGLDEADYVKALLGMGAQVLEQLQELQQTPQSIGVKMHKTGGLANALGHAEQHLAVLAQDPANVELAKQLNDELQEQKGQLQRFLSALQKEVQEAMQQEQQGSPEMAKTMAKIQAMQMEMQAKIEIQAAKDQQKIQHKDAQWSNENERRNADTQAEIQRGHARTAAEIQDTHLRTRAEVAALDLKTAAEIQRPKPEKNGEKKK